MGRHSATTVASESHGRPAGWFTRLRAVLAGALVLGVGAAVTVAAWNDSEFATGSFTASTFEIVGSTDGAQFNEHPDAANAAALSLTAPFDAMSPGTTVYARFVVKTTDASTVGGTVSLAATASNSDGLGFWLRYGVRVLPEGAACSSSTFDDASTSVVVPSGSTMTVDGTGNASVGKSGTDTANYCFAIALPSGTPNEAQGTSVNAQWTFTAESNDQPEESP